MTFEVEIQGRTRTVSIESVGAAGPEGGRFRATLDGVCQDVHVRATDLGLFLTHQADGRCVDIALTERPGGEWLLQFPHVTLSAVVDGRRFRRSGGGPAPAAGEQRVTAPMPGRVVRILVKVGDEVALRQGLVVVEAMKMENELASPKAGRVKEVAVTEGLSVESGRLLVIVE
jgi:acetyl/propionyl-CoA carboxylase alpha subunit